MAYTEEAGKAGKGRSKGDSKKMTQSDLRAAVKGLVKDAISYATDELGPSRAKATQYYKGEPFGNEEDGRSQFVMTEVRDTVLGIIPGMLRVIFGPQHVVEYAPRTAAQVQTAEQATDYARWVFEEDNAGLLKTYSVLVDGLVRRIGIYKWGVDSESSTEAMKGHATQSQIEQLLQDQGFELQRVTQTNTKDVEQAQQQIASSGQSPVLGPDGSPLAASQPQPAPQPVEPEFDIEFTYSKDEKRIWIEAVPDNEFIYNREARDIESAILVGHKMRKSTSDLIALGIDAEIIEENGGDDTSELDSAEVQARQPEDVSTALDAFAGEENEKHLYIEAFVKIDFDGDGIAELRKICTLGPNYYIVDNDPVASRPFSIFTPIPEPHTLLGQSYADLTMDLQLLKSSMVRAVQDSAAASIFPRIGYVEGHVSVADIMNTAIGGPIRMRQQGDIQALTIPFLGGEMLPLISYFDDVKESRTGRSKGAMGLDADALQSTEKAAAGQIISVNQEREEVLARIFAEQALKPMFRGILELIGEIHPKKQMLKMRGAWTEIDPETWDLNLGVSVNVMLGTAAKEQKLAALESFTAKQELILQTLGPNNPLVNLNKYSNTLRAAVKLLGFPDVDSFFGQVDPSYQPPAPQPPPDPKMLQVQAEAQNNAAKLQMEQQKLQFESNKFMMTHQLNTATSQQQIAQQNQDMVLKHAALVQKHAQDAAQINAQLEQIASNQALAIKNMELTHETSISQTQFDAQVALAKEKAKIESVNVQTAARIANEKHLGEMKAGLEHERSLVEMGHKHAEAMKPEPPKPEVQTGKPTPAAPPKIEIHNHIPAPGKVKVVRGKDNKITGVEPTEE